MHLLSRPPHEPQLPSLVTNDYRVLSGPAIRPGKHTILAESDGVTALPVRSLLEPVVEPDFCALAKVGLEAASTAQAGQFAGARAGHDEPLTAHDVARHRALVLQQERAVRASDLAIDPLDAHE